MCFNYKLLSIAPIIVHDIAIAKPITLSGVALLIANYNRFIAI